MTGFPQFVPLSQSKNPLHTITMLGHEHEARQLHVFPLSG